MEQHSLLLCALLLVAPVLGNLPSPVHPQHQTQGPPPVTTPMPTTTAKVSNFQFDAFFDLFIKNYGRHSLRDFQRELDTRKKVEGMPVVYVHGDPIPCPAATVPSGAEITYDNPSAQQHEHGSMARVKCITGHRGDPSTIMCKTGHWTAPPTPVSCVMVTCDQMPAMQNAIASVTDNVYGSQVTFICNPGYQAIPLSKPSMCQADGTWSTPSFSCLHPSAFHRHPSPMNGMNNGAAGALGNMMGGFGGGAAKPSLSPGLMNVAKQALASAMAGAAGPPGAPGGNPMASMLGGLASMTGAGAAAGGGASALMSMMPGMAGMFGNMGGGAAGANPTMSLPPHLKGMVQALPMLAGGMGGPMGAPGMPGAAGPGIGASQMEPEERMMMAMMMSQWQRQQAMRAKRQRQLRQQQQEKNAEQKQPNTRGINISELLTKGAMGGSGGSTPQNQLMSAFSAMGKLMAQQLGGTSSSSSPTSNTGETAGQNTQSVFGSGSGSSTSGTGSSSSGSSSSPSSTSSADAAAQAMRQAIMKAALG